MRIQQKGLIGQTALQDGQRTQHTDSATVFTGEIQFWGCCNFILIKLTSIDYKKKKKQKFRIASNTNADCAPLISTGSSGHLLPKASE